MTITAVIPVKKNSSRLPNKNILDFADTNLLAYKIGQFKSTKGVDKILVSSDSEEMLGIALDLGVDIDRRPLEHANESRPFSDFLNYIITKVHTKHLLWGCCTSPLMGTSRYDDIIKVYYDSLDAGHDSLITVLEFKHFLLDDKGPMNFQRGRNHVNSQDLPSYNVFTNGAILAPVSSIRKWQYHFGENPYRYSVSQFEAIDIDTPEDYIFAKAAYSAMNQSK